MREHNFSESSDKPAVPQRDQEQWSQISSQTTDAATACTPHHNTRENLTAAQRDAINVDRATRNEQNLELNPNEKQDVDKIANGLKTMDLPSINSVLDKYKNNSDGFERIAEGTIDEETIQHIQGSLAYGYMMQPDKPSWVSINAPDQAKPSLDVPLNHAH